MVSMDHKDLDLALVRKNHRKISTHVWNFLRFLLCTIISRPHWEVLQHGGPSLPEHKPDKSHVFLTCTHPSHLHSELMETVCPGDDWESVSPLILQLSCLCSFMSHEEETLFLGYMKIKICLSVHLLKRNFCFPGHQSVQSCLPFQ